MLQSGHLVAQAVVGQGAEIVPPGVPVLAVLQRVQRLGPPAVADVLRRRGLVLIGLTGGGAVFPLLVAAVAIATIGIPAI